MRFDWPRIFGEGGPMLTVRNISSTGYRSLRRIGFPVEALSVFIGGNGVGKTNLYRALERLQAAAAWHAGA